MIIADVTAYPIFGRKKVRLLENTTSGQKKGRIVAKPQTCNSPIRASSRRAIKIAKARRSPLIKIKSRYTKRMSPTSQRIRRLNVSRLKPTKRSIKKTRRMK